MITTSLPATFSANAAQDPGPTNAQGGAIFSNGSVQITRSTFSGNSADLSGHAIFLNGGALSVENSTLSGNLGGADPALVIQNANVILTNTTIVGNSGVGLNAFSFDGTNTLDVENTIVANNGGNDCSISPSSPIGKCLLNHEEGDVVEVKAPSGTREYEILRLTTIHDQAPSPDPPTA